MKRLNVHAFILLAMLAAAACAAPAPTAGGPAATGLQPSPSRKLVAIARAEPAQLASKSLAQLGIATATVTRVFNAGLALMDDRDNVRPYLVEALPHANSESWRIAPDGRMETIYKLRPGLTWHDGKPLTSADFAFAARVYGNRDYGVAVTAPVNQFEEVLAPDLSTLVIRWLRTYPNAARMTAVEFQPLPAHLLEEPFRQLSSEAFMAHPFWTTEYVGAGPYRLERWEEGAAIETVAFAGHVLGQPTIERMRIIFVPDPNTAVANLFSGAAQVTFDEGIRFQQGVVVRREWGARGAGSVLILPGLWRFVQIQLHPERMNPRALADVRVRRALASTLDRDAVNDGIFEGEAPPAFGPVPPNVDYYAEIERTVVKYPYDPRQAQQLMSEAGFTRGGDSAYTRTGEGPLSMELRVSAGSQNEAEQAIMASVWRSNGFGITEFAQSTALSQDPESRVQYPALRGSNTTPGEEALAVLGTAGTPRPENRWFGTNRGSWSNAEYDRLVEAFHTTVDRSQRVQQILQMLRILSEDVPSISLNFTPYAVAIAAGLNGPVPVGPENQVNWNIHEWTYTGP
jgi:peptide/nickel transport system substrate-binding protein